MLPIAHKEEEWTLSRMNSLHDKPNEFTFDRSASPQRNTLSVESLKRKPFVFADPVAFRYLEDDPDVVVLEPQGRLVGYELYLVEQWACSRVHPTFVITTYTGDQSHSILVGVLGVPADEERWSPRLKIYFAAISQYHARAKDTALGVLMVSNLSSFPSALTVIAVPGGDIRKHREDFFVNEDLKRLGCSGRSGMSLTPAVGATQAKFYQLYKASEQIPFYDAVIGMVKLCQIALLVFGKLEQEYADGLLCDVTEKAINDWWVEIGSEHYNAEPSDGILGPSTVAGLLGLLMGARNRLNSYGAPVAKDAFDIVSLKRGIQYFQKSQKIDRTRRLDRHTLNRLHAVTAKAAANEGGWAVPKAVKSTVAELSGKGGEMMLGMVGGGRDKGAIGDVETLDINDFVTLAQGERSKWLWHGKLRRSGGGIVDTSGRSLPEKGSTTFGKDEQGGYLWSPGSRKQDSIGAIEENHDLRGRINGSHIDTQPQSSAASIQDNSAMESERESLHTRKGLGRVAGKMSDARSGFGRIKDAVGLRGHIRTAREGLHDGEGLSNMLSAGSEPALISSPGVSRAFSWKNTPESYANGHLKDAFGNGAPIIHSSSAVDLGTKHETKREHTLAEAWQTQRQEIRNDLLANEPLVEGDAHEDSNIAEAILEADISGNSASHLLQRRSSMSDYFAGLAARAKPHVQRHVSFSDAEETILCWEIPGTLPPQPQEDDNFLALQHYRLRVFDQQNLHNKLKAFRETSAKWIESQIGVIEDLDNRADQEASEIQNLYFQLSEAYSSVRQRSDDVLGTERSHVTEAIKDIEVLGSKLEYEINALLSKVDDLKDGVATFESHVAELEARADELDRVLGQESWMGWVMRMIMGFGRSDTV